jgi:hypothetical protein
VKTRTAAAAVALVLTIVACTLAAGVAQAKPVPGVNLTPTKAYLLQHTTQLGRFTPEFRQAAAAYYALGKKHGFDYRALWAGERTRVTPLLAKLKASWIEGNPYYERMEGIVAGTPSLAVYDVILDAGSSAKEDPASAVPFDLQLADGRVLRKPGNLYNLTEGMLWGSLPQYVARVKVDLDTDGKTEFGEVLPDAHVLKAAADAFVVYAGRLDRAARAWQPTASDAFTAIVVMVPTMNEYFGQWKVSRFVLGDRAKGEAFNVVSRLSDIHDILGGLNVIYAGVRPAIARIDANQAAQTKRELDSLSAFVERLYRQERAGKRFSSQQADVLGRQAQERATAIAGQVTQIAARLGVKIVQ